MVVVNRDPERSSVPVLSVDYADGIRTLTQRLIKLGHRRFIYLSGPVDSSSNSARLRSLRASRGNTRRSPSSTRRAARNLGHT